MHTVTGACMDQHDGVLDVVLVLVALPVSLRQGHARARCVRTLAAMRVLARVLTAGMVSGVVRVVRIARLLGLLCEQKW